MGIFRPSFSLGWSRAFGGGGGAPKVVEYVGKGAMIGPGSASLTVAKPADTANGDLLFYVFWGINGTAVTTPAGHTLRISVGLNTNIKVITQNAAATAAQANQTFTTGTSTQGICLAFRGVDVSNPLGGAAAAAQSAFANSQPYGACTAAGDGMFVRGMCLGQTTVKPTYPTWGQDERHDANSSYVSNIATKTAVGTETLSDASSTSGATNRQYASFTLALFAG